VVVVGTETVVVVGPGTDTVEVMVVDLVVVYVTVWMSV
jgi:hypothetical protein